MTLPDPFPVSDVMLVELLRDLRFDRHAAKYERVARSERVCRAALDEIARGRQSRAREIARAVIERSFTEESG